MITHKMLPKIEHGISNGGLYQQSIRCGKASCRCASGDLHEGYFYLIYRVDGRLKKLYVPKGDVDQLRSLIFQAREDKKAATDMIAAGRRLLSSLSAQLRDCDEGETNMEGNYGGI